METLKKLLNAECDYRMADETMDRFLGLMTEVHLKNKEPMISYGRLDNSIYIVKEGVIRHAYFDGLREKTFAFAAPGTLIISYHSFCRHSPSVFQYESCGESIVMKVSKEKLDNLLGQSVDFTNWLLRMSMYQLCSVEKKAVIINGTAEERVEALIRNRPYIIEKVSNRVIASYIGVEQSYWSRLKRRILPKSRK